MTTVLSKNNLRITRPMLAASIEDKDGHYDLDSLPYPLYASVKLDGIRALTVDGRVLSRSFKPIPNLYIQKMMSGLPSGLDGELLVEGKDFSETSSGVMSVDGEPSFLYYIFDYVEDSLDTPFQERLEDLISLKERGILPDFCRVVVQHLVKDSSELLAFEESALSQGYEGVMLRRPSSIYKCGRSSLREGYLIKLKRFTDSEAVIIGYEELMSNRNQASTDELGYLKRSSSKEGLVPMNTLGALIVRDLYTGQEFSIGTGRGLNMELRRDIWNNREVYLGKIVRYRYQKIGAKDLPRIPSFQGFRDPVDMG